MLDRLNIVVSTGAGISAESGINTFRDSEGLWSNYDPMKVAHIKGWQSNPQEVLQFKNELRRQLADANPQPNAAHLALAKLQKEWKHGEVTIITQNIDGLHKRAGSVVYEMHGSASEKFCEKCGDQTPFDADIVYTDPCQKCQAIGSIRPFTVLFGEMPLHLEAIEGKLDRCDIYATIGSSCEVMPANLFHTLALANDATTYLINKEPVQIDIKDFRHVIYGDATIEVPKWVAKLLNQYALRGVH